MIVLLVWLICRVLRLFSGMLAADITSMPTVAPGDTITAAGWNVITANIALLGGRTGGDPGSTGKIQQSTGTLAGGWTTPVDSTVLSDRKVSAAGDTMSGTLTVPNLTATNAVAAVGAVSGATLAASNTLTTGGSATIGNALSVVGILSAASAALTGAFSAASAGLTGALTAASSTLTGLLTAANVTATNALSAGGSVTAGNAVTAVGTVSGATIAATTALTKAAVTVLNQTEADARYAPIAVNTKVASGTYSGNNTSQSVTVGFQPKAVWIYQTSGSPTGAYAITISSGATTIVNPGTPANSSNGNFVTFAATSFTLVGATLNGSGNGFAYVAIG